MFSIKWKLLMRFILALVHIFSDVIYLVSRCTALAHILETYEKTDIIKVVVEKSACNKSEKYKKETTKQKLIFTFAAKKELKKKASGPRWQNASGRNYYKLFPFDIFLHSISFRELNLHGYSGGRVDQS